MFAVLKKLIPIRDWLYAGAFIALLAGFGWFVHHERQVGEQKIEAADARAAAAQLALNKAKEAAAQTASTTIGATYEKVVRIPVVGDLGVSCVRNNAPAGSDVSKTADNRSGNPQAPIGGNAAPFDPTGAALTVGRDADAQINALIDTVNALTAEMK